MKSICSSFLLDCIFLVKGKIVLGDSYSLRTVLITLGHVHVFKKKNRLEMKNLTPNSIFGWQVNKMTTPLLTSCVNIFDVRFLRTYHSLDVLNLLLGFGIIFDYSFLDLWN